MENKFLPKKLFLNYWLPFFIWASLIFIFSSYPTSKVTEIHWKDFVIKKTAHLVEYSVFTVLLFRALKKSSVEKKTALIISILVAIAYGFSDEFHQSFTPGREPKIRDVLIDTFGILMTAGFVYYIAPKLTGKLKLLLKRCEVL